MGPTDSQLPDRNRAYLKQALVVNPLYESAALLALRRQHLGLKPLRQNEVDGPELREKRANLVAALDRIRNKLWTIPQDRLIELCNRLDASSFPDLNTVHVRLLTVTRLRDQFAKLPADKRFDATTFENLKRLLVMPASEATKLRLKFARSLTSRKRILAVRKMLDLIDELMPDIYDLEQDWFDSLRAIPLPGLFGL